MSKMQYAAAKGIRLPLQLALVQLMESKNIPAEKREREREIEGEKERKRRGKSV